MSNNAWKLFISALSVLGAMILVANLLHSIDPISRNELKGVGADFTSPVYSGTHTHTILALATGSPLAAIGARVGDRFRLDDVSNATGRLNHDGVVGLTLFKEGTARHVFLKTSPESLPRGAAWQWYAETAIGLIALAFGLIIAFKQPESRAYRYLAFSFAVTVFNSFPYGSPPGIVRSIQAIVWYATVPLWSYATFMFALYLEGEPHSGIRAYFVRAGRAIHAVIFVEAALFAWFAIGHDVPWQTEILTLTSGILTVGMIVALWDGRRAARGEERQRQTWILACFAAMAVSLPFTNFFIEADIEGWRLQLMQNSLITLLAFIVLLYAVLKYRVFNFGFVINRAVFYSATTLLLLVTFGIVERLSDHFLHFEGRKANVALDAAIALGIYLAFHRIRHSFDQWLERVFFHKWHSNEAKLRQFVRQAAHITRTDALLRDFHAELTRFAGGANCLIYLRNGAGNFAAQIPRDPAQASDIDVNDPIPVMLRSAPLPTIIGHDDADTLVLPMHHRGELRGFVILKSKPNGEQYRPDEIEVLSFATAQVDLDLYALLIEQLQTGAIEDALKICAQDATINHLQTVLVGVGRGAEIST